MSLGQHKSIPRHAAHDWCDRWVRIKAKCTQPKRVDSRIETVTTSWFRWIQGALIVKWGLEIWYHYLSSTFTPPKIFAASTKFNDVGRYGLEKLLEEFHISLMWPVEDTAMHFGAWRNLRTSLVFLMCWKRSLMSLVTIVTRSLNKALVLFTTKGYQIWSFTFGARGQARVFFPGHSRYSLCWTLLIPP
jgi:hypothetical protein